MKTCPVGAELFHADGRTNKTKPTVVFRSFLWVSMCPYVRPSAWKLTKKFIIQIWKIWHNILRRRERPSRLTVSFSVQLRTSHNSNEKASREWWGVSLWRTKNLIRKVARNQNFNSVCLF